MLKFKYSGSTKSVWLIGPLMKVGSAKSNDIVLSEDVIAPLHCYLHVNQNKIEIEPVEGNEVYINEVLVKAKTVLKLTDITRIGTQEFSIIDPQSKAAIIPAPTQSAPVSSEATVFRAPPTVAAVSQASGWMLQGLHKNLLNKRYPIDGTMSLGRSQDCELHFSYDRLSRKHAELKVIDNVLIVRDLDSSNGTYHNGEKIKQAKLRGGDTIAFDKLEFTVIAPSSSTGEGVGADSFNQTVVRSALTPEMMKQASVKPSSSKTEASKKSSATNALMIAVGVLIILVVAAVIFLK